MEKYNRQFYLQPPFTIARELIGSYLYSNIDNTVTAGKIVEVETYIGKNDKASHAFWKEKTDKTAVQYEIGGHAYVYLIYGLYSLLNVVASEKGEPNAILIRAVEPVAGIDVMKRRRNRDKLVELTSGPGKLCMAFGIGVEHNGEDLLGDTIWITPPANKVDLQTIVAAKRIGVDYAEEFADKYWRFYIQDNKFVSKQSDEIKKFTEIDFNKFV